MPSITLQRSASVPLTTSEASTFKELQAKFHHACMTSRHGEEQELLAYNQMIEMFKASVAEHGFSDAVQAIATEILQQAQDSGTCANPFLHLGAVPQYIETGPIVQALVAFTFNHHAHALVFDTDTGCNLLKQASELDARYQPFDLVEPERGDPFDSPEGINPFMKLMRFPSTTL